MKPSIPMLDKGWRNMQVCYLTRLERRVLLQHLQGYMLGKEDRDVLEFLKQKLEASLAPTNP